MKLVIPTNYKQELTSARTHMSSRQIYARQVDTPESNPPATLSFWQNSYDMNYCHEVAPSLISSSDSFSMGSSFSSDDESSYCTAPSYPLPPIQKTRHNNHSIRMTTTRTSRSTHAHDPKYKTTLCTKYDEGRCGYGDNCKFAHGPDDIRLATLGERHAAGLLDKDFYCARRCFIYDMTGACPYYGGCDAIHDPAVKGPVQKTLRHKMIGKEITTSHLYYHQMATVDYACPFGPTLQLSSSPTQIKNGENAAAISDDDVAWYTLFSAVCNIPRDDFTMAATYKSVKSVSEKHRLEIALIMRGSDPKNGCPKYQPNHIAHVTQFGITCMVKSTRAFQIQASTGNIKEISMGEYNELNKNHIIAREIAFGTINNPDVHDYAIWFNLPKEYLVPCTNEEARNHSRQVNTIRNVHPTEQINDFVANSPYSYFILHPTLDIDAFNLQTGMLRHRLQSLTCNAIEDVAALNDQEQQLKLEFKNLKKYWVEWSLPVNSGREDVDENSNIPSVEARYSHPVEKHNPNLQEGQRTVQILKSFNSTIQGEGVTTKKSRLPVFDALKNGVEFTPPSVKAEVLNGDVLSFPLLKEFERLIQEDEKLIQSSRVC